jgi:Family of unknown function (DUF6152)
MRSKIIGPIAFWGLLLAAAAPAFGHHSVTAEFDPSKTFTVKGVLKHVDWTNPHIYLWVDVTEESGEVASYSIEGPPPGMLHRAGLTKDEFKTGETVTVLALPAKDGSKRLGLGRKITYADGHSVRLGSTDRTDTNVPNY